MPSRPAIASAEPVEEVRSLTGLRAMAALMVLSFHYDGAFAGLNVSSAIPFVRYGHLGVDVFFALSGYILCHVYASRLARFEINTAATFLFLRLARIYPVHIVGLLATVAIWAVARFGFDYVFNDPGLWRITHIPFHLTLTHAWGLRDVALWNAPSWSISSEWLAYLTLPLILPALCGLGRLVRATVLFAAASVLLVVFGLMGVDLAASFKGIPVVVRVLGEFWLGASVRLLFNGLPSGRWGDLVAGAIVLGIVTVPYGPAGEVALIVSAPFLVLALHKAKAWTRSAFACQLAVYGGRISYSVYIIHFPVQLVLMQAYDYLGLIAFPAVVQLLWYFAAMAVAVAAGSVLFHTVEDPIRRAAKRRVSLWHTPRNSRLANPT